VYLTAFLGLFAVTAFATVWFDHVAVTLAGLAVLLVGILLLYRSMTRPLSQLSEAMGRGADSLEPEWVKASGPAEIARVASRFNALAASVEGEISERRRAEAAARVSERNYRLLFEGNPQPLVVYGVDTLKVLEVNDAAIKLYGYTRDEFITLPAADLLPVEQATALASASVRRLPDLDNAGPAKHRAKDGRVIEVTATSIRLVYDGHDARLVLVEDLTERKGLEGQLQQSQRLDTVGHLAGGIAHDFNNLLAVVLNYPAFIEDKLPDDAELRDDLLQIQRAAERGAVFTRQLLTFAHQRPVNVTDLQLNNLIPGLRQMLHRSIPESIAIELRLAPDLWMVRADAGQLEQLLLNLVVNAGDAMPKGGTLLIQTTNARYDEKSAAQLTNLLPGPYVRLTVTDTGEGMTKEVVEHAFEPFFTTKPTGKGTGLGLATVYGITKQAGGNVSIYSEVAQGTSVRVLLPAQFNAALSVAPIPMTPSVDDVAERTDITILLVEDEPAVRTAAVRILRAGGYTVFEASSPAPAIELARSEPGIDLLVTDMVMPEMSGRLFADWLRKASPQTKVIFISGYLEESVHPRDRREPGMSFLAKPFNADELASKVRGKMGEGPDESGLSKAAILRAIEDHPCHPAPR